MRLVEERNMILIQISILIGITITALLVQYSNDKIDSYNSDVISTQGRINDLENKFTMQYLELIRIESLEEIENLNLKQVLNVPDKAIMSKFTEEIRAKYLSGEISQEEFLKTVKEHKANVLIEIENLLLPQVIDFNQKRNSSPKCFEIFKCKNLVSIGYIIQLIFIIISLSVYLITLNSLTKRIKK